MNVSRGRARRMLTAIEAKGAPDSSSLGAFPLKLTFQPRSELPPREWLLRATACHVAA
jgi:hypothetical protein